MLLALPFVGLAVLALFAFVIEPDPRGHGTHEKLGLPACRMMEWFHVPCPGCGVTTSVALAARGQLAQSVHNQPFGILVALAIPVAAVWVLVGHARGRDLWRDLQAVRLKPWAIAAGAVLAACWIYKLALTFGYVR